MTVNTICNQDSTAITMAISLKALHFRDCVFVSLSSSCNANKRRDGRTPANSQTPTQPLTCHFLWEGKKTEGRCEDSWNEIMTVQYRKKKLCTQAKQSREINLLLPTGRQIFSHFLESTASAQVMVAWEDKHHNH